MSAELILDLPWDRYIEGGYLGSSALDAFPSMSLEAFSAEYLETGYADKAKATAAMVNGSELDRMLTAANYDRSAIEVRTKEIDYRTKDGKKWRDERLAAGKTIIAEDDLRYIDATLPRVREALQCYDGAPRYQVTLRGEIAGIRVQTRPDIMICNCFPDLKYNNSDAFDRFDRQFPNSRYVFQAGLAFGLGRDAGIENPRPSFLLAESGTLHPRVHVVELSESDCLWCWRKTVERIEEIAAARDSELGFVDAVKFRPLNLPAWAVNE